MTNTRREFLQVGAALAVSGLGGATAAQAQSQTATQPKPTGPLPPAAVQVPTIEFGGVRISRMVLGVNPLYGFSHFNSDYSSAMRAFYTGQGVRGTAPGQ